LLNILVMNCPRCRNSLWNPFGICGRCGYSIQYTLENPSSYQAGDKWPKHGLLYDGFKTIVDTTAWGSGPGTKFVHTLDIAAAFETVAASGTILIPNNSGRDESYIFYFGTLTGGRPHQTNWQSFYAVRLVKPNDPNEIHIFADNINFVADKEVICGQCGKSYQVATRPTNCTKCLNLLRW
jgi:hypothetical protein